MKCTEIENKIWDYIEEKLDIENQNSIKKHLNECSKCANMEKALRSSLQMIEGSKRTESDPFFFSRLEARMENEASINIAKTPYAFRMAIAASIAIVGIVGGSIFGSYSAEQLNNNFAENSITEQTDDLGFELADNSFDLINDFK
jgi:hypothetical protein